VTPYYNRPSQAGIEAHMHAIAAASNLPVVVHDIPVRTGRKISSALLLKLAREVPTVVALKDAAGNPGETANVIAQAPLGYEVYSGDDSLTLPLLAVGAVGVIGVATHWTAPDHRQMFDLWEKGDIEGARQVNARMLESFAFETTLAGRGYAHYIPVWQAAGYAVHLVFLRLPSATMAVERVAVRVAQGGHHVPAEIIARRFDKGWHNFQKLYRELVDGWQVFDNAGVEAILIEQGGKSWQA